MLFPLLYLIFMKSKTMLGKQKDVMVVVLGSVKKMENFM